MPKQKTITVYTINELTGRAQERAYDWLREGTYNHNWWDFVYSDAETVGLKITSFDLDRNRHAEGEFTQSAANVAKAILENHGASCETHKTASVFLKEYRKLETDVPTDYADEDTDWTDSREFQEQSEDCENEFLKSLLEDYSIMLQKESEHMSSKEYLDDMAEANGYEFDESGRIV